MVIWAEFDGGKRKDDVCDYNGDDLLGSSHREEKKEKQLPGVQTRVGIL